MALTNGWPKQMEARLRVLWAEGLTGSQIAGILTHEFRVEVTRNAVIGRCHRLRLAKRPSPIKDRAVNGDNHTPKPRAGWRVKSGQKVRSQAPIMVKSSKPFPKMSKPYGAGPDGPTAPTMPTDAQGEPVECVSLEVAQETGGCRWPYGTRPYAFCGAVRAEAGLPFHADPHPYCIMHRTKARPA